MLDKQEKDQPISNKRHDKDTGSEQIALLTKRIGIH